MPVKRFLVRVASSRQILPALLLLVGAFAGSTAAHADINTFTLRQPLNNATVRETVPIRAPRAMLNQAAYAQVEIDGIFRDAPAVPTSGDLLYVWDTKSPFTTPDNPTPQTTADGQHTVMVRLYDHENVEIADATSSVRVANLITTLPDGVRLVYKWRPNEVLAYSYKYSIARHGEIGTDQSDLQDADIHFDRAVEDTDSDTLLRDSVNPYGTITAGATNAPSSATVGTAQYVQTEYNLAAKFWTIDSYGHITTDNQPIGPGQHFGFPIAEFPPRRVNVGDSWETTIMVGLEWAVTSPTFLHGTARLDDFEWEDGYPTAKVVETYDGPARFTVDSQGVALPAADASHVHVTRTVWFAYEAGMLIRTETTLQANPHLSADGFAALGLGNTSNPAPTSPGPQQGAPYVGGMGMPQPGAPYAPQNPLVQGRQNMDSSITVDLQATSTMELSGVGT
jgi:hypothetical protein